MKTLKTLIILSTFFSFPINAFSGNGTSSANFLKQGTGARYLAMGGAAAASADDANALFWNPANLALAREASLSLTYGAQVESLNDQFAGYVQPAGRWGAFGAAMQMFSAGTLSQTDDTGARLGTFAPRDAAGLAGWGRRFFGNVTFGLNAKLVQSRILSSASTWAADAGLGFQMNGLAFGLAARNMGGKLKFDREESPLPLTFQAGAAWKPGESWLIAVDGSRARDEDAALGAGLEWKLGLGTSALFLRGGYNTRTRDVPGLQGMSAGLGWRWSLLDVDYAWIPMGDLGQTHRASVNVRLGSK